MDVPGYNKKRLLSEIIQQTAFLPYPYTLIVA